MLTHPTPRKSSSQGSKKGFVDVEAIWAALDVEFCWADRFCEDTFHFQVCPNGGR